MPPPYARNKSTSGKGLIWDLLTFNRLLSAPLVLLVYWAGLGVIALIGFAAIGAAVGLALRNDGPAGWLLAIPALVAGLLVVSLLVLLWRATCEFYIAVCRISDDLRALRQREEQEATLKAVRPPPPRVEPAPRTPNVM